jgi:hypothetical protein
MADEDMHDFMNENKIELLVDLIFPYPLVLRIFRNSFV